MGPVCLSPGTPCHINKVLSHPTLPITITAQEDRHIKFFDNNSGKLIHSMVAHLDAVTSLAVDPNGLYLMSGSKYLLTTMSSLMVCLSSHLIWQQRTHKYTVGYFPHSENASCFLSHFTTSVPSNSLQVTTALFACGTWRVKPVSRSSRLTGRSSRSRSTTWRFIRLNATLPALGQTLLPKCLYDAEPCLPLQPRSLTQPPMIRDQ